MSKRLQVPKELERLLEKREAEKDRRATAERLKSEAEKRKLDDRRQRKRRKADK